MTRLRSRQPFLDRTNSNEITNSNMATKKTTVVLRKPSTRVKKSTEWKRRVPGDKNEDKNQSLKKNIGRVVKVAKRKTSQVKDEVKTVDKFLLSPRVHLTRLITNISPKKNREKRILTNKKTNISTEGVSKSKSPQKKIDGKNICNIQTDSKSPKKVTKSSKFRLSKVDSNGRKNSKQNETFDTTDNKSEVKILENDLKSPETNRKTKNIPKKIAFKRNIRTRKDAKSQLKPTNDLKSADTTLKTSQNNLKNEKISTSVKNSSDVKILKSTPTVKSPKKLLSRVIISPRKFFKSPSKTNITPKKVFTSPKSNLTPKKSPTKISKRIPARTIARKLKENLNTITNTQIKTLPKRQASKNAITKIVSALKSDSPIVEVKKLDVFDFTFDSDEEPVRKKGRLREIVEDSGDENNSMKGVVRLLRKKEQRKIKTATKKVVRNKKKGNIDTVESVNRKTDFQTLPKDCIVVATKKLVDCNVGVTKKSVDSNVVVIKKSVDCNADKTNTLQKVSGKVITDNKIKSMEKSNLTLQEKISESFDDYYDDNYQDFDSPVSVVHQKTITEEIVDSFQASLEETTTHLSPGKMLSDEVLNKLKDITTERLNSPKINVISDVLIQPRNVFNSTTNSILDESNPWRLSVSNIKNTHTFTIKDKSFIPNYNQEIVINSTFTEKLKPTSILTAKKITDNKHQSSILNFVTSSKETKNEVMKAGSLFQSPRKVLAEINFTQSTPFHPRQKMQSPNFSIIANKPNDISNLFGFSYDENSENIDPSVKSVKKMKKRSPKKEKIKAVLFNDVVEVKKIEEKEKIDDMELSNEDMDLLFQDVENDKEPLQVKKSRHSYQRSRPKRRRLPSEESIESDDDSIAEVKIKVPSKRTKKEEQEADRLASHYNSMFEEIDKFDLIID